MKNTIIFIMLVVLFSPLKATMMYKPLTPLKVNFNYGNEIIMRFGISFLSSKLSVMETPYKMVELDGRSNGGELYIGYSKLFSRKIGLNMCFLYNGFRTTVETARCTYYDQMSGIMLSSYFYYKILDKLEKQKIDMVSYAGFFYSPMQSWSRGGSSKRSAKRYGFSGNISALGINFGVGTEHRISKFVIRPYIGLGIFVSMSFEGKPIERFKNPTIISLGTFLAYSRRPDSKTEFGLQIEFQSVGAAYEGDYPKTVLLLSPTLKFNWGALKPLEKKEITAPRPKKVTIPQPKVVPPPKEPVKPVIKENYVYGKVTDAKGVPLANVIIKISQDDKEVAQTITMNDGTYRSPNLPLGLYQVKAWIADYHPQTIEIEISEEPTELNFSLIKKKK